MSTIEPIYSPPKKTVWECHRQNHIGVRRIVYEQIEYGYFIANTKHNSNSASKQREGVSIRGRTGSETRIPKYILYIKHMSKTHAQRIMHAALYQIN